MQSPSTIFNFLMVALVVVSISAAPYSHSEFEAQSIMPINGVGPERTRNIGPRHTDLRPGVLRRSDTLLMPKTATPRHTTTKTRRMVYGWGPRGFDEKDDGEGSSQSDLSLLAADPAETSEHVSKVTKQSAPSGPTKPKNGTTAQPPAEVIKTLCHFLISGNSSEKGTVMLDDKGNSSAIIPPKKSPGITTDALASPSSNKTGGDDKHNGKGDKYYLALSWCHEYMNHSSHDTGAHSGSTGGQKPTTSANVTTLVPPKSFDDPSTSGSKKSPSITSNVPVDTVSDDVREGIPADKPTTRKNFKIPSNLVPSF
ncbi:hypothetical protein PtB15_9B448 [Puccinia triticina]|nr:hypothetical protein PtB15_9B448 [Puccinia triticina]